jgi:hypothetical protein
MNERHPIRNSSPTAKFKMRKGTQSSIFMKTIDKFGKLGGRHKEIGVMDDRRGQVTSTCVALPKEPTENKL